MDGKDKIVFILGSWEVIGINKIDIFRGLIYYMFIECYSIECYIYLVFYIIKKKILLVDDKVFVVWFVLFFIGGGYYILRYVGFNVFY